LRVCVRSRLNRTADLDGEVDAAPGLKIPGAAYHALAELVEQDCVEVIVTTNLDPMIVTAFPRAGIERRSRAEALPRSQAPTESRGLCS
jgi:hypothetical protein